jgi:hypothetical protein
MSGKYVVVGSLYAGKTLVGVAPTPGVGGGQYTM